MKRIPKYLLSILMIVFLSGCALTYSADDLNEKTSKVFPQTKEMTKFGMTAKVSVMNPSFSMSGKQNRLFLNINISASTKIPLIGNKTFKGYFIVSAQPVIKGSTIYCSNIKVNKFDAAGIPNSVEDIIVAIASEYIQDVPIVELTGVTAKLVKSVSVNAEDKLVVNWGI
ncbi:MAG: hypothetical protein PF588_02620 [Candidatus Kapabacteria bacterium]|jgi:hypothetical protein|nr:hypothetical protein [Candidatus Kapabacteria bacterium]